MPEATNPPPRGLRFALLAHPSVQAVRFAAKLALPWFLTTEQYGEAVLPSLIVFGFQHVAVFGLDEALVSARSIDAPLWRAMRRFQDRLALALAVALAAAGLASRALPPLETFGLLLAALAPMLVVANRATLPTWLLVRERRFFDLFLVDLAAVIAFALVTLCAAAANLGPWSLVLGWWANAAVAAGVSAARARDLVPRTDGGAPAWRDVRRTGGQLTTAAVLAYAGDRADGAAVGFGLDRAALGLYENAQNLAGVLLGWGQSVADRYLFPTLAADERGAGSGAAYLRALRATMLFVLPPHAVLALASDPLVRAVFPASWHATAPIFAVLSLAAAARCADLLGVTALKAGGHGRDVARLAWIRIVLVGAALAIALPLGLFAAACAVAASRAVSAALALAAAARRVACAPHRAEARLGRAGLALLAWALATAGAAAALRASGQDLPAFAQAAAIGAAALAAWVAARALFDGECARAELEQFRARFERGAGA